MVYLFIFTRTRHLDICIFYLVVWICQVDGLAHCKSVVSPVVHTRDDELDSYYHACLPAKVIYSFMHVILAHGISRR